VAVLFEQESVGVWWWWWANVR